MTNKVNYHLLLILTGLSFLLFSCEPDPCRDTFCYDGSECVDGICFCLVGQYGNDCSSSYSADVSGLYSVMSICASDTSFYSSSFTSVTDTPWLLRLSHPYNSVNDTVRMEGIFDSDGLLSIRDTTINIDGNIVMLSGSSQIINNDSILLNMDYDGITCQEIYYK